MHFRTLTSRYPSEKEHSILIQLLEDQKNLSEKNDKRDQFLKVGHYRARSGIRSYLQRLRTSFPP